MKVLIFNFIIIASTLFCSCDNTNSKKEKSRFNFKKINCYVRYLEEIKELQGEITFMIDSNVHLKSDVLLNGENMLKKDIPQIGLQYRLTRRGLDIDSSYVFNFSEKDQTPVNQIIKINEFDSVSVISDGISINKGGLISWSGNALQTEDALVIIITDTSGESFTVNHTGLTRGNKFEINKIFSNKLKKGSGTMRIIRKKSIAEIYEKAQVLKTYEHYLLPINIEIKD